MSIEDRYTLFKQMEKKKPNKILEERYRLRYEEINCAICDILRRSLLPKSMEGKRKVSLHKYANKKMKLWKGSSWNYYSYITNLLDCPNSINKKSKKKHKIQVKDQR